MDPMQIKWTQYSAACAFVLQIGYPCSLEYNSALGSNFQLWADKIEAGTLEPSSSAGQYLAAGYDVIGFDFWAESPETLASLLRTSAQLYNDFINSCNLRTMAAQTPSTGTSSSTMLRATIAMIAPIAIALAFTFGM